MENDIEVGRGDAFYWGREPREQYTLNEAYGYCFEMAGAGEAKVYENGGVRVRRTRRTPLLVQRPAGRRCGEDTV